MRIIGRTTILNNIVSPYGFAFLSYAVFWFAYLIPPAVYTHYMKEPDLVFLDPVTMLFYTLCVMSFVVGAWFIAWIFPTSFVDRKLETRISPVAFLLVPLLIGVALTMITLVRVIKDNPSIIVLLLSQRGGDLKDTLALDVQENLVIAPVMLIGTIWWAAWRYSALNICGWRVALVKLILFASVLVVIVSSTVTLSRNQLMMVICGLGILYIFRKTAKNELSLRSFAASSVGIILLIPLLFFATSYVRGIVNWDDQINTLLGYSIASYNRLAAIVNGSLRYPFAGRGIYLSYVAAYSHALNHVIPLGDAINPPGFLDLWSSEFEAVTSSGLDGNLIWSGAFGYIFSDLGWFSLPFIFGYGLLYGFALRWIKKGKIVGIVLYPYFGYCALLWFTANSLLEQASSILLLTTTILMGYEYVFAKTSGVVS